VPDFYTIFFMTWVYVNYLQWRNSYTVSSARHKADRFKEDERFFRDEIARLREELKGAEAVVTNWMGLLDCLYAIAEKQPLETPSDIEQAILAWEALATYSHNANETRWVANSRIPKLREKLAALEAPSSASTTAGDSFSG
jgi:hypothetical protein